MMMLATLLALHFITLHGPHKGLVFLNPEAITAMRTPRTPHEANFPPEIKCLVFTGDGKFASVIETCSEIQKMIQDHKDNRGNED